MLGVAAISEIKRGQAVGTVSKVGTCREFNMVNMNHQCVNCGSHDMHIEIEEGVDKFQSKGIASCMRCSAEYKFSSKLKFTHQNKDLYEDTTDTLSIFERAKTGLIKIISNVCKLGKK